MKPFKSKEQKEAWGREQGIPLKAKKLDNHGKKQINNVIIE